jgi:hypothetical protein
MDRASYRYGKYQYVHDLVSMGTPYKEALKQAHTTEGTIRKGRTVYHHYHPTTPRMIKDRGHHSYTIRIPQAPIKAPLEAPRDESEDEDEDEGPWDTEDDFDYDDDILKRFYEDKQKSVEAFMDRHQAKRMDQKTLDHFIDANFNASFAPIVKSHYHKASR